MASSGDEESPAPKRSMSSWKTSRPGTAGLKGNLLSQGRHRTSSPDMNAMLVRGERRSQLPSRPGTVVGNPRLQESGSGMPALGHRGSLESGDILGTSPLESEPIDERESGRGAMAVAGGVERSEKSEDSEVRETESPSGSPGSGLEHSAEEVCKDEESGAAEESKRDERSLDSVSTASVTSEEAQSEAVAEGVDNNERERTRSSEREAVEVMESKDEESAAMDSTSKEEEEENTPTAEPRAEIPSENDSEGREERGERMERETSGENGSEGNSGEKESGESAQSVEDGATLTSSEGNNGTPHDSERDNVSAKDSHPETGREKETSKESVSASDTQRETEKRHSGGVIPLRPFDAAKLKEKRPFSDFVAMALRVHEKDSVSRRGTEISGVAPSPRSFCSSSSQQKVIINSTGQKREHSLKSATVLGQRDARNDGMEALSSILRRSTVSQADPFQFSSSLPSSLAPIGDESDAVDVPFRKGRSGTVSVSPVDYHQSQQQFWFAGGDDVACSPDAAAQAAQPPQSRLRNETFVMPIICSIGAIPTSSLLKNPMIQELRTQFSEAHGITNMHTIHVYEAFHFMKQLAEVSAWLPLALGQRAPPTAGLEEALGDGTLLCELANTVKSGVATPVEVGHGPGAEEFGRIENVAKFLAACEREFDIDPQDLFCEADVIEKKSLIKVVHGLHVLAKKAPSINEELPSLVELDEGARDAYDPELVQMAAKYVAKVLRHHMAPLQQT